MIAHNNKLYAQEFCLSKTSAIMIPAAGVTFASLWASDYLYEIRQKHNFKERTSALWYALPQVGLASSIALAVAWYNAWSDVPYYAGVAGVLIVPGAVKAMLNRHYEKKSDEQQAEHEREMQRLREIEENKQKAQDAMSFLLTTKNIHRKDSSEIGNALHNLKYADQEALSLFADKLTVKRINELLIYVNERYFCAPNYNRIYNNLPRLLGVLQNKLAPHNLSKVDIQKMLGRDFDVDKNNVSEISEIKFRTILSALCRFVPDPFDSYCNLPFPEHLALLIEMYPRAIENVANLLEAREQRERVVTLDLF